MARSTISIAASVLGEILPILSAFVRIVGSESGINGVVCLVIEGEAVPDAPMVMATVSTESELGSARLQIVFEPI
jgi:hypothetical protein